VVVVFLLAIAIRLAFFGVYGVIPNNDSIAYRQLTKNLILGNGYSDKFSPPFEPQMMRLPGYPLFLAPHFRLGPRGETCAILTQILLGALTCVLVVWMTRRFLPSPGPLIAGVFAALDVAQVYLSSCILSEVLFTFLAAIFFLYSMQPENQRRPLAAAGLGTLLAAAIFVRPSGAFLIPVFALAILLAPSAGSYLKRFTVLLCFLLPVVIATQAWCLRNYRVSGFYGLSVVRGYYALWKAVRVGEIRPEHFTGEDRLVAELAQKNGLEVFDTAETLRKEYGYSYPKINAVFQRIGRVSMMKQPVRYFRSSVFDFFNSFLSPAIPARALALPPIGWENAQQPLKQNLREGNYGAVALNMTIRLAHAAVFFVLMPLGGCLLWRRRRECRGEQLVLWGYVLITLAASAFLAGGSDRFRAPLDPILLVFVSAGVCRFLRCGIAESSPQEPHPGTQRYFDETIERIERFRRLNHYYHEDIVTLARFYHTPGDRVLEVGCGTGDLLAALDRERGVGVDFSQAALRRARQKYPSLRFVLADAQNFALRDRFDIVVMSDLIGYLEDVQTALENVRHCMGPHSRLLINFFNHLWEPGLKLAEFLHLKNPAGIQNWLSLNDVKTVLHLGGFEAITCGYRFLFPYKVPLLASFMNRFVAKLPFIRRLCLVQWIVAKPAVECPPDWKTRYSCSVIIPTRNELGNIAGAFERTPFMGKATELIFVDGNSTDGTVEEIERRMAAYRGPMKLRLIHQGDGIGKADAVRKGFEAAGGDILMILDSDLTMPPEELPKYYRAVATGRAEFANGCRLVYPMDQQAMRLFNYFGNKMFSTAFSWLLGQTIRDTLCGTKVLFRRDYEKIKAGRAFFGEFDPFGDFDLLFGAARIARKIVDLPIRYRERTYGETKISRWRHGFLLLRMCGIAFIRFKLN
jgi:ubiquinone/menaquinone biosynthesis C-methylase UbiE/uncharacterized membrane protein